jgi:hypothetical protein
MRLGVAEAVNWLLPQEGKYDVEREVYISPVGESRIKVRTITINAIQKFYFDRPRFIPCCVGDTEAL